VQIFINVGILLSYVSNYAFAGLPVHIGWRLMYAIGVIPPVLIAAGVLVIMPESPRWLAMQGRHADARAVLLRTSDSPADADFRLGEIKRAADAPSPAAAARHGGGGVWRELFVRPSTTTTSVRRILGCVLGLQFFVQASGVDAILLYSPLCWNLYCLGSIPKSLEYQSVTESKILMTCRSDLLRGTGKHTFVVVAIFIPSPCREAAGIRIRAAVGCRVSKHSDV
jgi:MFS family permease